MENIDRHIELESYFKEREEKTVAVANYSRNEYLVIRMDGIGLSKRYLSECFRNKEFEKTICGATSDTFRVLHRKCPHDSQNFILAAIVCSDEVSVVLSKIPNYFENRIMKIVTTFASTLTSFFTRRGLTNIKKKNQKISGSFDGRAIILNNKDEIVDYLATRYAVNIINSCTKFLRLSNVDSDELYSENNFNNIDYIQSKVRELNLEDKVEDLYSSISVFISKKDEFKGYNFKSIDEMKVFFRKEIDLHEDWLESF